jgi:hypothetical protein
MKWKELSKKLEEIGVFQITIGYSGGGDSGDIDYIEFINKDGGIVKIDSDIENDVREIAFNKILDSVSDWYNNEGGGGTLMLEVPSGEWKTDHYVNIIVTENESYDGNIED